MKSLNTLNKVPNKSIGSSFTAMKRPRSPVRLVAQKQKLQGKPGQPGYCSDPLFCPAHSETVLHHLHGTSSVSRVSRVSRPPCSQVPRVPQSWWSRWNWQGIGSSLGSALLPSPHRISPNPPSSTSSTQFNPVQLSSCKMYSQEFPRFLQNMSQNISKHFQKLVQLSVELSRDHLDLHPSWGPRLPEAVGAPANI